MSNDKITTRDQSRIREWKNVRDASVDNDGDVWVSNPCAGHWLSEDAKAEYIVWRNGRCAPAGRQASSRQARTREGGKAVHVVLSPDAAKALAKLLKSGYSNTIGEVIDRALVKAAR